jgi:hypothetical protein
MSTTTTRWNLVVSKETDKSLRQFLADEGGGKKGDLSRFVEEAVKKHIFDLTLKAVRDQNANMDPAELDAVIEESLAWARKQKR